MGIRDEVHRIKGRMAEIKTGINDKRLVAAGLIMSIRQDLDPFEEDVTKLNIERAEASMDQLLTTWTELKELVAKEARLKAELGE